MNFILDENITAKLIPWLEQRGHGCRHVRDCGLTSSPDRSIWAFASQEGAVIITLDRDYQIRRSARAAGPVVVWLRFPNLRTRAFVRCFAGAWPEIARRLALGDVLIEVPPPSP